MGISVETLALAKSYTNKYVETHGGTDEIFEYDSINYFPSIGKAKSLYVDLSTNLAYRWSGSTYVEVSPSIAIGETSETAYRGDRGSLMYTKLTNLEKSDNNNKVVAIQNGILTPVDVNSLIPNGDAIDY
jgi:hypothetical protein